MPEKTDISLIILTLNEEVNLRACLESTAGWVGEVFIVDSGSTDKTLDIAKEYTPKIYQHPFQTQSQQFNWALENLPIRYGWVMRLDADEIATKELAQELKETLPRLKEEVSGLYLRRKVFFRGRWIRHGGYYPLWL